MKAVDSIVELLVIECPDNFTYVNADVKYSESATNSNSPVSALPKPLKADKISCSIVEALKV